MILVFRKVIPFLLFLVLYSSSVLAQDDAGEWIQVYFNMPADHSVAIPGNESKSTQDLIRTLESLIDSATASVDLCIYDLEEPRIAHALARSKDRGVRVRLITDNHNRSDGGELDDVIWEILREAGIQSMDDDGDVYHPDGGILDHDLVNDGADMHNKFAVIDHLSPDPNDDHVWTGSTNLTYTGNYNTNHSIIIKDADVAAVYTEEFNQMWGSESETPNPLKARFHKDKVKVSEHIFDVGGTKVEVYFAPNNRDRSKPSVSERIVELLGEEAQHDISFQAFAITPDIPISKKMWELSEEGVFLNGVIDRSFYNRYRNAGDIWASEEAKGGNQEILPANELRKLHHKLIIIDAENPDPDDEAVVVAGSYNFSLNAENNNDENTVIIHSDEIANQFYQDLKGVMSRAKEESFPPAPVVDVGKWYDIHSITDGSRFQINVAPGFGYSVRLLGVNVPSVYANEDSSYYYSGASAMYLRNILEGRKVRLIGYNGDVPEARYNAFQAYVEVDYDGKPISLNKLMLEKGYGHYSFYYRQNEDSIEAFKYYESLAKSNLLGLWQEPEKIGMKIIRADEVEKRNAIQVVYPININSADRATLQLLPGIGPAFSQRIVNYREENGGFKSVDEITNIKGIGPKTLQKLRPIITID